MAFTALAPCLLDWQELAAPVPPVPPPPTPPATVEFFRARLRAETVFEGRYRLRLRWTETDMRSLTVSLDDGDPETFDATTDEMEWERTYTLVVGRHWFEVEATNIAGGSVTLWRAVIAVARPVDQSPAMLKVVPLSMRPK